MPEPGDRLYTGTMPKRQHSGPDIPDPTEVVQQVKPSLRSFLRGRFFSANGVAAALYLTLSIWIYRHPERAKAVWQRLQRR